MTETERYNLIILLKCCSANLANKISNQLQRGSCDDTDKLIILNGLLELIIGYNVTTDAPNCLTSLEFDEIVAKSKNICDLCDCNN